MHAMDHPAAPGGTFRQHYAMGRQRAATRRRGSQPPFDHAYDREAAWTDALRWTGERNSDWPAYDRGGGNCGNFTSQALLAGGIPMDHYGTSQWKWYGQSPTGRSGSWSSVKAFHSYAKENTGYDLMSLIDQNNFTGDVGDIIQLGYDGNCRHAVIITDVTKNEDGETVDYLICSNTSDQRRFPVSAYVYLRQRLIKILGWNEGGRS